MDVIRIGDEAQHPDQKAAEKQENEAGRQAHVSHAFGKQVAQVLSAC